MCELYSNAEPELFSLRTRSIRIDGVVTSIRLEGVFWQLLQDIADSEGLTLSTFISRLYHEASDVTGNNFTSLLRVAGTTYLNQQRRLTIAPITSELIEGS